MTDNELRRLSSHTSAINTAVQGLVDTLSDLNKPENSHTLDLLLLSTRFLVESVKALTDVLTKLFQVQVANDD